MNDVSDQREPQSLPPSSASDGRPHRQLASLLEHPRVLRSMLGFVAGMVFALVLVHMYEIATGTYPAGKMEMVERRDPPVTMALMLTSVVVWSLIGLLPRRVFLTAIGAGAGCVAGYFLAWGLAGVRLGDPLYLEYQIGIREWMPLTIPGCAAVGALIGFVLAGMRPRKPSAVG